MVDLLKQEVLNTQKYSTTVSNRTDLGYIKLNANRTDIEVIVHLKQKRIAPIMEKRRRVRI